MKYSGLHRLPITLSCILGCSVTSLIAAPSEAQFHVSPNGDDTAPGSEKKPFATLTQARNAVRIYKKNHPKGDINVWLHKGTYRLKETLVFGLTDSGNPDQTITYAAWPGDTPVLSGSLPVKGWEKLKNPPAELPEAAKGKVWSVNVSAFRAMRTKQLKSPSIAPQMDRADRFLTLYQGNQKLPRAHGKGFLLPLNRERDSAISTNSYFPVIDGIIENWADVSEAEIVLIPDRQWVSNILPIKSVDMEKRRVTTTVPGTYNLSLSVNKAVDSRIENSLALLDEPGEWMVDRRTDTLYLWPPTAKSKEEIEIPILTELIRIEGEIDYSGPKDTPVRHLVFKGLTFVHGDRFPWSGNTGWGIQHDWDQFDAPNAMLRFRGAESCAVHDCRFLNAGSTGLRLDLHAQKNKIVGNRFDDLGGTGILLAGYGPGTKDVNRNNIVENNHISKIGQSYWGSPGIFVWQSGENRVANNLVHDTPYNGMVISGRITWGNPGRGQCSRTMRWNEVSKNEGVKKPKTKLKSWQSREKYLHARNNLILRNDIHDVMILCGDGNCIYISGAGGGNKIIENYCHDVPSTHIHSAIRCDDHQEETIIERNICHRIGGAGEGAMIKGNNTIRENLFVDLRPTNKKHKGYLRFFSGDVHGSVIERNVFYSRDPAQHATADGKPRKGNPATQFRHTLADYNLYFNEKDPQWGERHLKETQEFGIEKHSLAADPMFTDIDNANFQFRPESPALKLGIRQPIDVNKTGLQSKYRTQP